MTKLQEFFDNFETQTLSYESDVKRIQRQELLTQVEELTASIIFTILILILAIL